MKFTKKANNAIRRFISSSAATVQSRKRIKLALGSCPSAAEKSHGAVLAANFHERPTDVDELGRIRQMIELENVWTAKTTINLCQGDPNADPTPVDIFSLTEMAEGENYFVPSDWNRPRRFWQEDRPNSPLSCLDDHRRGSTILHSSGSVQLGRNGGYQQ